MKQVIAFIKPHRLHDVMLALHGIDRLSGVSVSEARGFGRGRGSQNGESETEKLYGFIPHVRIDVFCHADLVDSISEAIESEAHTGLRGDGKIFVSPVESAVRISTGERGEAAV